MLADLAAATGRPPGGSGTVDAPVDAPSARASLPHSPAAGRPPDIGGAMPPSGLATAVGGDVAAALRLGHGGRAQLARAAAAVFGSAARASAFERARQSRHEILWHEDARERRASAATGLTRQGDQPPRRRGEEGRQMAVSKDTTKAVKRAQGETTPPPQQAVRFGNDIYGTKPDKGRVSIAYAPRGGLQNHAGRAHFSSFFLRDGDQPYLLDRDGLLDQTLTADNGETADYYDGDADAAVYGGDEP
jgi:hypothetical protein